MAVQHFNIEGDNGSCDDDGRLIRTGTLWTCIAHIITAVIGSGVLSLAWSTSQLGWIVGPVSMLCFAMVTYVSAFLLSDCYRSPHPVTGTRNYSYMDAVRVNLGRKQTWVCGLLQYLSMYGTGVAYVITTSTSMRAIQKSNCYHREGHQAACSYGDSFYMLLFGAIQILFSQIPDFHNMEWLSILAAIMSFSYSSVGFGLGLAKVIGSIDGAFCKMRLSGNQCYLIVRPHSMVGNNKYNEMNGMIVSPVAYVVGITTVERSSGSLEDRTRGLHEKLA